MLPNKQSSTASSRDTAIRILLAIATLIAFGNLCRADFCSLDDPGNISANPDLNPPSLGSIARYWVTQHTYFLYIPLTYTVWGGLAAIAYVPTPDENGVHLNPWVFHSANVVLHVCSVLAAYGVLHQILRHRRAACIGALFYGLHPLQVEAVGWAAGLKDVLSGMLALIALWQYIIFARAEPGRSASTHYGIATFAFVLAMLAKPSAMMTPIIALAIDYWLIGRPLRRSINSLMPWIVLMIACAINARIAQAATIVPYTPGWARLFVVGDSLTFYLRKMIWPVWLGIDYGRRPAVAMADPFFYYAWIIPVAIGSTLVFFRRKAPELLVGGIIFLAATTPILGAVPFLFQLFSTTADHYLYLAMLGPGLAVGWLVLKYKSPPIFFGVCAILLMLGMLTIGQTQVWQNDFTLFHRTLFINPNSVLAMNDLGQAYLRQNQLDQAQPLLEKAIALDPNRFETTENLYHVMRARGNMDRAIELRKKTIAILGDRPPELRGDLAAAYNALGKDLLEIQRFAEARDTFLQALKIRPDFIEARVNLGRAEQELARNSATNTSTTRPTNSQ